MCFSLFSGVLISKIKKRMKHLKTSNSIAFGLQWNNESGSVWIKLILFFILNWILAFPAIYYLFILKIDFFHLGEQIYGYDENFISLRNLSNKIILLPSIIAIHLLPIIFFKKKFNNFVLADLFYLILYYILIDLTYNKYSF